MKFCGGCNPQVDRKSIYSSVNKLLKQSNIEFVRVNDFKEANVVFLINGCAHACLEYDYSHLGDKFVSIQGDMFNYKTFDTTQLPYVVYYEIIKLWNFLN